MLRKNLLDTFQIISESIREALSSVLPIVVIVLLLCLTIVSVSTDLLLCFLLGVLLVICGMGLFSLGAESSMTPIGNKIGTSLTKSKNLTLILSVSFLVGFSVTIAEPDLQVLAQTVPHIQNAVLLLTVGIGVGFFLLLCMLRILTGFRLRWLLLITYGIVFLLAMFTDKDFLSIAFDSGGVTTGPMTVPFILAFGMGVSNIRSDKKAEADSFGLVSLCSVGPIIAVLLLGFFYRDSGTVTSLTRVSYQTTSDIGLAYLEAFPTYMKEMALALLPIVIIFFIFQVFALRIPRTDLFHVTVGLLCTYVGLVLFLTGVNVGFSALGNVLGESLAMGGTKYFLIPLAMMIGWFVISAEPAVVVLQRQIEEVSAGAIPGKVIKISLSIAISLAMGVSMLRILTGISIFWFLVPGYAIAFVLSFYVPDIYTAIAFDSGGVASGPMTATFMLQFAIGAAKALGSNILQDAFGLVAMVAMMPLISIQMVGFLYSRKKKYKPQVQELFGDYDIVELWEIAA